ncbi:putative nonribosomal peptide synthetase [Mycena crocata]|nr:putative nonribosomal peptide synthetase [Mycena crocata]
MNFLILGRPETFHSDRQTSVHCPKMFFCSWEAGILGRMYILISSHLDEPSKFLSLLPISSPSRSIPVPPCTANSVSSGIVRLCETDNSLLYRNYNGRTMDSEVLSSGFFTDIDASWGAAILDASRAGLFNPTEIENVHMSSSFQSQLLHGAYDIFPSTATYTLRLPPGTDIACFHAAWEHLRVLDPILRTGFIPLSSDSNPLCIVFKSGQGTTQPTRSTRDEKAEPSIDFVLSGRPLHSLTISGCMGSGYRVKIGIHYSLLATSGLKPVLITLHRLYHQRVSEMCNPYIRHASSFASASQESKSANNHLFSELAQNFPRNRQPTNPPKSSSLPQARAYETITRPCPFITSIQPQYIIRMATGIALALHSTLRRETVLICEVETIPPSLLSARLIQLHFDLAMTLQELMEHTQNQSAPAATQRLIETVGDYGWEAAHVLLNIHTSASWPQAHDIPGWRLENLHLTYGSPLSVDIVPTQYHTTEIRISFDTSAHLAENVHPFADHFVYILQFLSGIHQNPALTRALTVHDILKELGDADAPRTLEIGRRQQLPKETLTNVLVHDLFEASARENPSSTALEFEGLSTLTYGELDILSSDLAVHLHHKYGVEPDVMVPILFEPSFEMIIAILAVMKAGGAYVPLGLDLPIDAMRDRMGLIGGKVFICGANLEAHVTEIMTAYPSVKVLGYSKPNTFFPAGTLERRPTSPIPHPAQLAYVLFTSGTTGVPNGVGVEHRNLTAFLQSSLGVEMAGKEKRKLLLSAYTFDISAGDIFSTLTSGGVLSLVRRERMLSNLPYWVDATKTTHLSVTPSIARLLPANGLPTLSHIIFGGEIVPPDLAARLNKNRTLINSMGPTEATIYATFYVVPKFFAATNFLERVPIGYPLETTILYILRPCAMELAALSEIGEICIGGPQVARGYITNPQLSKLKFVPDVFQGTGYIFRTGDWGRWNHLGQLEILGRMDGQLKYHGIRIESEEIERVVRNATDIDLFYAGVLEIEGDQKLVGALTLWSIGAEYSSSYHVLETSQAADTVATAIKACEDQFPANTRPSTWLCLNSFPKTAHGKLDSRALKKLIKEQLSSPTWKKTAIAARHVHRPPTADEDLVLTVVADVLVLSLDSIGLDASFIELGGTSMQAMRLTTSLQALGLNVSVIDVLDNNKTIAHLAQLARFDIDSECSATRSANGSLSWQPYRAFSLAPQQWERGVADFGIKAEDIEDIYPCTSLARYWIDLALMNNGRALICQFHHVLGRNIDPELFTWCWEQLLLHEPSLRTIFIQLPIAENRSMYENGPLSVVLKPAAPARWKRLEIVRVADGDELQKKLFGVFFAEHRLELGQVPIRAWLIYNTADDTWSFGISRHHALHDARTFDLQHDAFSQLYAHGAAALPALCAKRSVATSYGAYMASVIEPRRAAEAVAFWTAYLQDARPALWPAGAEVPSAFCKDMGTYAFHVAQWSGSIHTLAKRAGVTPGALVRGAYAVATAEGEGEEEALVFEVADGSGAAGLTTPPWGFCSQVKPTRIRVPHGRTSVDVDEGSRLLQIMREANRSHVVTLPYVSTAWEMAEKILGEKVVNFATSIVNILDLSRGDFRKDMKTEATSQESFDPSEESVRPLFSKTLASESVVGIYVPVYVEVHILKDKVVYACPYDPSMVQREDMERFISRQVEALEMVNRKLGCRTQS